MISTSRAPHYFVSEPFHGPNLHGSQQDTDLLQDTNLLAPTTGANQSLDAFFPAQNVHNPASTPSLQQSTSSGIIIGATAGVFTAPPRPSLMSERPNESLTPHGPIQSPEPNTCQECTQSFPSAAELERHAKSLQHAAFECMCGKTFARPDNLKRHWKKTLRFPCPHCNRYTGANAFVRKDHLTQHLRIFHRINNSGDNKINAKNNRTMELLCTWPDCPRQQSFFRIKSHYTDHLRRIHDYSPFPCPVQGCVRIGGKGYFRESELVKHSKEMHSVED